MCFTTSKVNQLLFKSNNLKLNVQLGEFNLHIHTHTNQQQGGIKNTEREIS